MEEETIRCSTTSQSAPFRYEPGESIALSASVHDPYGETNGIQFNVNDVPIDQVLDENDTTPNSFYWQSIHPPVFNTTFLFRGLERQCRQLA